MFAPKKPCSTFLLASVWLLSCQGVYAADAQPEPDLELGEEINEVCASCHGEFGQGGKGGEYPRLAGLPPGISGGTASEVP